MSKPELIQLPNRNLRVKSRKIKLITSEIKKIISDMEAITIAWDQSREHEVGVALAAVQINQLYRIIIVREQFEKSSPAKFKTFINPEIIKTEGEIVEDYEGCLSINNIYGKVPRHNKVRVKALGLDGKSFRIKAEGFLARVLQHEIDHNNGLVFIDHIKDKSDAFFELESDGKLIPLDYEKKIKNNPILWS